MSGDVANGYVYEGVEAAIFVSLEGEVGVD